MPLFKIESLGTKRVLIKANTINEIIQIATEKFQLAEASIYKLFLEQDNTEIDDDEILCEYAKHSSNVIVLKVLDINRLPDKTNENDQNISNKPQIIQEEIIEDQTSSVASTRNKIDLEKYVWSKISTEIVEACKREEKLSYSSRRIVIQKIVEYMIEILKDTSRSKATEMAKLIYKIYPKTFGDIVGADESWGVGFDTLRLEIYNAALYKTSLKKRKRPTVSSDSDDEEREEILVSATKQQDEYGCVEYAPLLPTTETSETQNAKRLELINCFILQDDQNVLELMTDTYPTLRAVLNNSKRNLNDVETDWPFLFRKEHFLNHASRLLGKDIIKVWSNSLNEKVKVIRQYFKYTNCKAEKKEKINILLNECKSFSNVTKDLKPKQLVIFRLIILHFNENEDFLYKVIKADSDDMDVKEAASSYPTLIIRGDSLYDEKAKCNVVINKEVLIDVNNSLDGILISFVAYYLFGINYPREIEKSLEFIQRVFMKINPPTGGKRLPNAKPRSKSFDSIVFKLAKDLSEFSNLFKIGD